MKRAPLSLLMLALLAGCLSSCGIKTPTFDYQTLAKASIKLGVDINLTDNKQLYIEAADWIGVPYRAGGTDKQGVDCSGFTSQIYKKVYKKKLERSTVGQMEKDSYLISKHNLQEGDLVFFSSKRSGGEVAHVGVYLKENKFIHASTSGGVVVSNLKEKYYLTYWIAGGEVKK